jgi:hypothetical protein
MTRLLGASLGIAAVAAMEMGGSDIGMGNDIGGGRKRLRGGTHLKREKHPASVKKAKTDSLKKMLSGKPKRV